MARSVEIRSDRNVQMARLLWIKSGNLTLVNLWNCELVTRPPVWRQVCHWVKQCDSHWQHCASLFKRLNFDKPVRAESLNRSVKMKNRQIFLFGWRGFHWTILNQRNRRTYWISPYWTLLDLTNETANKCIPGYMFRATTLISNL